MSDDGSNVVESKRGGLADHLPVVLEMWDNGDTLKTIGDRFGVTRERVRQVLNAHGVDTGPIARTVARLGERKCVVDGCTSTTRVSLCKELDAWLCLVHRARHKRGADLNTPIQHRNGEPTPCVVCGNPCASGQRGHGMCRRCYGRWAYHNLPGRKEAVKQASTKWRRRKYQEDEVWRKRQREYQSAWRKAKRVAAKQSTEGK